MKVRLNGLVRVSVKRKQTSGKVRRSNSNGCHSSSAPCCNGGGGK
jgi:hypothetical protein